MGLLDRVVSLFSTTKPDQEDLRLSQGRQASSVEEAIKASPRQAVSTLYYKTSLSARGYPGLSSGSNGGFITPMYNLGEIGKTLDIESYFAASIRRHRELVMKEGWYLHGKDNDAIAYVKDRFSEIELIAGEPITAIIRELLTNLIAYGNSMLILKRDPLRSSGAAIRMFGKTVQPISGLYPADPTSMAVKKNDFGRPVQWKQKLWDSQKEKKFSASDVVHFTLDRKSGFTFGTPFIIPVLEDIRALRRLEELAELVTHKHTFPLFHAKVGTKEKPAGYVTAPDGSSYSEVDMIGAQVDALPPEGGLVTTERVEINMLGTEGQVLDLQPYLMHFEGRVLGGLRLSGIDLGRGDTANRATAQTVTKSLVDACSEMQNVFAEMFTAKVLDMLLLEGGFDLNKDTRVTIKFPDIDREEMRAHQNHGIQLFLQNAITQDELRTEYLNKEAYNDKDRKNTHHELYIPQQMEGDQGSKNAIENKARPTNQHGKAETKKSIPQNSLVAKKLYDELTYSWGEMCDGICELANSSVKYNRIIKSEDIKRCLIAKTEAMVADAKRYLTPEIERGAKDANSQIGANKLLAKDDMIAFLSKHIRIPLIKLNRKAMIMLRIDLEKDSKVHIDLSRISSVFDVLKEELKGIAVQNTDFSYKYGYLAALEKNDIEEVKIVTTDENNIEKIEIKDINDIKKRDISDYFINNVHIDLNREETADE